MMGDTVDEAPRSAIIPAAIAHMGLRVREVLPAPDSYSSTVAILMLESGERAVLKVAHNREKFFRELRTLELLAGRVPIPRILDVWDGDGDIPGAFLLAHIEGGPAGAAIDERLAREMGEMLARLHEIPMPGCGYFGESGFVTTSNDNWWAFMYSLFLKWARLNIEVIPVDLIRRGTAYFERTLPTLPDPGPPVLVHMDYRPGNILVHDNRIGAVIDFESTRGGSPGIDFTKMKLYAWDIFPGTEAAFRAGYSAIRPLPDLDRLLPFHCFMESFGAIGWCVQRGRIHDHYLPESISRLEALLETHEGR